MSGRAVVALISSVVVILGAGFPLTFSLYATSLQSVLGYTQTEVNTVNIANIVGQFIIYPLIGALSDKYGANVISGCGAFFSVPGLLLAASAYEKRSSCLALSATFFCIGIGSNCGYITAVSTCARALPERKGLGISLPVCAYGLATLIFSVIFQAGFSTPDGYDIASFWRCIAAFATLASIIGYFGMKLPQPDAIHGSEEIRPLMAADDDATTEHIEYARPGDRPPFFRDVTVLLYALGYVCIAGSTETFVGNLGSMLESIQSAPDDSGTTNLRLLRTVATQTGASTAVSVFAVFSTLSRLIVGWASDYLASRHLSRFHIPIFLVGLPLILIFALLGLAPMTEPFFLLLVGLNGFCYGSMYCSGPGIGASVWGLAHFGRNWGVLSYAPLAGSTLASLLYARLYDRLASSEDGICHGQACFSLAFRILAGVIAIGVLFWLSAWRLWRARGIQV